MASLTIQQAFDLALQHHHAGRLPEAEQLYRQILVQQPEHSGALNHLGLIAHQVGRNDDAVDLILRAIALRPDYALAHNNLGNVLRDKKQLDEAIAAYRQAIALNPNFAGAHSNLGRVLRDKGQLDEAIIACQKAIAIGPGFPEVYNNLGSAMADKGKLAEAISAYRQAITLRPGYADGHYNLGNALKGKGQIDEAITAYRQAIALQPNHAEAHVNLAQALGDKGLFDEAITACEQAIALRPNFPEARSNLGSILAANGQLDEAIAAYRQAIALRPEYAEAHVNLGSALTRKGKLDEAVVAYRQAIALNPNSAGAHRNLGNVLCDKGQLDEGFAAFRQAIRLDPAKAAFYSTLIYSLHFHPAFDAKAIAEEHRRWNIQHAEPLRKFIQPHSNDRDPDRRLKIGYVSPDFRDHCQSCFTIPLLAHHNHDQFEIFCYANVSRPDAFTDRIRSLADTWRSTIGMSDQQVADLVRKDRIDILVDLTMHMADGRPLLFARKPAPVQVAWLAYPGTTGLSTIDYRLTDPYLDPPGQSDEYYSEKSIRLPDTFWCYQPMTGEVEINPLPALTDGRITFGCLNNFCKINDGALALWAKVLRQVEGSRLLLLAPLGNHRQLTLDRLWQEGIGSERIEFVPRLPPRQYLELYHRIDLGLDSLPYNGHTTSLDSFWMGVPVVTLVDQTAVSRAGWCQLSNLKLTELAGKVRTNLCGLRWSWPGTCRDLRSCDRLFVNEWSNRH